MSQTPDINKRINKNTLLPNALDNKVVSTQIIA